MLKYKEEIEFSPDIIQLKHQHGETYFILRRKPTYIEAKWYGHITADEVVTAAKAIHEFLVLNPCSIILNDQSEVTGDWHDANDWLEFEWLPNVVNAGLHKLAHVHSFNMFNILSANDLRMRVTPLLEMSNFYDVKTAKKWLLRPQSPSFQKCA